MPGMGCDSGCAGYELLNDLDFDENGDGTMSAGGDPTYWNEGAGWLPIGQDPQYEQNTGSYNAIFEGNGKTISNLYINRHITNNVRFTRVGLFGFVSRSQFRNVGLENPYISITRSGTSGNRTKFTDVGALIGNVEGAGAAISGSWVNGGGVAFTQGEGERSDVTVGCLAGGFFPGTNQTTENPANYATCAVYVHSTLNTRDRDRNIARAGGLIGSFSWANASASYARGNVTCRGNGVKACGGLFGLSSNGNIVSSYATGNVVNEAFSPPQIDFIFDRCRNTYGYMLSGGLTGYHLAGDIRDSYSTGRVAAAMATPEPCTDGRWAARSVGGLGIRGGSGSIANSYWDVESSGIDYNDGGGAGHTTARLTNPTGYADIYANWNRDLDGGGSDDPWDFGTGAQYPILTWRHDVLSQRRQRARQPTVTQYELPPEPAPEYVAPPIVYNLNIRFNVKGLTLDKGESATYRVRMSQSPVGHPARVAITSNNPDVTVSPTEVTFSSANYREWQTVSVSVARDANDTDESANIAHRGPNLSYGSILVMVNDIWPGTTTETVNGHTLTLHHTADAPAGVTITAPATLDTDAAVTVAAAPSHTPLSAPGYGFGAETAARMLASIRVNGAPSDGLSICLAVPAALVAEAGERPLALLRYAGGVWQPVAGAERREGAAGMTLLCAAGVTEYGVFAAAYTLPALGAVSDFAAAAGDTPGTITLTWTPGANAERHWLAGVKQSDLSQFAVWSAADNMGSHTVSNLEPGATYIFTVTAGRGEGDARQWSAWAPWATATAAAPTPSPTPSINAPPSPLPQ